MELDIALRACQIYYFHLALCEWVIDTSLQPRNSDSSFPIIHKVGNIGI